jgi:hypothetical protein
MSLCADDRTCNHGGTLTQFEAIRKHHEILCAAPRAYMTTLPMRSKCWRGRKRQVSRNGVMFRIARET